MDGCDSEMALMRTFSNLIDYEWISLWMIERPVQKTFCSLPVGSGLTAQVCIRLSRLLWTFPKYKTAEKFLSLRSLKLHFLYHMYRTQVYLGSDLWVRVSLTNSQTFVTLYKLYKWCHLVARFGTNSSGAIWWPNMQLMQVVPCCW